LRNPYQCSCKVHEVQYLTMNKVVKPVRATGGIGVVGVFVVENPEPEATLMRAGNRQGHFDRRTAGSRGGGQIRRPFTAVSARENLWPRRPGHRPPDTGAALNWRVVRN
jgi:hypothetical protein